MTFALLALLSSLLSVAHPSESSEVSPPQTNYAPICQLVESRKNGIRTEVRVKGRIFVGIENRGLITEECGTIPVGFDLDKVEPATETAKMRKILFSKHSRLGDTGIILDVQGTYGDRGKGVVNLVGPVEHVFELDITQIGGIDTSGALSGCKGD